MYEKFCRFEECVIICDLGLEEVKKWYYKNYIWIRVRCYYLDCKVIDDFDLVIKEYVKLVDKKKYWFMYYKVLLLYLSRGKIDDVFIFVVKVFDFSRRFDIEKMINLIYDLGILL